MSLESTGGVVTAGDAPPATAHSGGGVGEGDLSALRADARVSVEAETSLLQTTDGDGSGGGFSAWMERRFADFEPPEVWSKPPAALSELSRYVRHGAWAGPHTPWRTAAIWWFRLVGLPASTVAYYGAWIIQRPSRTIAAAIVYALLAHLPFLSWLLPWPSWLP